MIKLFTPSNHDYSEEFNRWLCSIPQYLLELLFVVKRFYKASWGEQWREHFSVDIINGKPANELKCDNRKLTSNFLRVGYEADGSWRVFGLRKDFHPAAKLQMEDDITASVVVPASALQHLNPDYTNASVKFCAFNTENRLFQRPDDAIHRGYDKQAEKDLSEPGQFSLSNFQPLNRQDAKELVEDSIGFDTYSEPMQHLIQEASNGNRGVHYFASSAHPRIVDGRPSKNPRYLQKRPDLVNAREAFTRRKWPLDCSGVCRWARRFIRRSTWWCPAVGTIPRTPQQGFVRSRFSTRFIIWNCQSFSWSSSPV